MFRHTHSRVGIDFSETVSMTEQSHKDECDIHKILNQYKRTGILNHIQSKQPLYADLPDASDFQASINIVLEGQAAFAALPSSVRDRFNNDPETFLRAFADPQLRPELESLGLVTSRPTPPPVEPGDA